MEIDKSNYNKKGRENMDEDERILALQEKYDREEISEEDIPEEDMEKLKKLYEKQINEKEKKIKEYRKEILKYLKNKD